MITLEATIRELAPGGDGVAIVPIAGEDRAVFASGVLPGERVRLEVDTKPRPARGRVLSVLTRSAARVEPPCREVERCGGCDWMHVAPNAQAKEHASIVGKLLGFGGVIAHAAPTVLGYRTRARVHVEAKGGRVIVGMYGRRSHAPAPVDTCVVLDPILDAARGALAGWLAGAIGRGEAQMSIGKGAVIDLRWRGELPGAVFAQLEGAVKRAELGGVRIFAGDVRLPATIGIPTPILRAADGEPLQLAPGGFAQASEEGNTLLAKRVVDLVRPLLPAGASIAELYSGAGNLSVLLAREWDLTTVEQDHDACLAARANLGARGLVARAVEADAATFEIPRTVRVVVLDPPRDGARAVAEAIAARPRPAIVYVSCDPPTLARDVRTLVGAGYALSAVETFEMFPQTSHVETIAVLTPPKR